MIENTGPQFPDPPNTDKWDEGLFDAAHFVESRTNDLVVISGLNVRDGDLLKPVQRVETLSEWLLYRREFSSDMRACPYVTWAYRGFQDRLSESSYLSQVQ